MARRAEAHRRLAVVTGASRGLGEAVTARLVHDGWSVVIDGREEEPLRAAEARLRRALVPGATLTAVPGDVADPAHRAALVAAVEELGPLDLLVNNASVLGPSPQPVLADYPLDTLRHVYEVNVFAPLALTQALTPALRRSSAPQLVNITSDAAVEPYQGWGGYGSSKAALEQVSAIWAEEQPWCRTWSFDPGDMRTRMHQDAFPGEDISDRPEAATVVPALLALVGSDRPSGRVQAAGLLAADLLSGATS